MYVMQMWVVTVGMLFYSQSLQKEGERVRTCINIPTQQGRKHSASKVSMLLSKQWRNSFFISVPDVHLLSLVQSLSVCIEVGQPSLRRLSRVQFW